VTFSSTKRAALIAIAKKKQARGMTTAYNAHKAKQQKGKTPRTKKNPNGPQSLMAQVEKALNRLRSLDASTWAEPDMTTMRTVLMDLKIQIETFLKAV